jgi:hypothetical protein
VIAFDLGLAQSRGSAPTAAGGAGAGGSRLGVVVPKLLVIAGSPNTHTVMDAKRLHGAGSSQRRKQHPAVPRCELRAEVIGPDTGWAVAASLPT